MLLFAQLLCVRSGFLDEMRFVDVILTERFLLRLGALLFHSDLSFLQPKLGVEISQAGYYLSIPSAIASTDKGSASSFRKLAAMLPFDKILTETGIGVIVCGDFVSSLCYCYCYVVTVLMLCVLCCLLIRFSLRQVRVMIVVV